MHADYTTIAKLILRASKKVNERHATTTKPLSFAVTQTLLTSTDEAIE